MQVQRFANVLKALGVKKGDRVAIYMGMCPELAIALLACARIGAVHSVIFGGFAAHAIVDRVNDSPVRRRADAGRQLPPWRRGEAEVDRGRGAGEVPDDRSTWWCTSAAQWKARQRRRHP